MRGVFDEREAERDRRRRGREKRDRDEGKRDREVTLGTFTLLAIFFGLVMLCGLSFGLGYVVGRREPAATWTRLEPTPIAAQGDSAKSKPSGGTGGATESTAAGTPAVGAADGESSLSGAENSGQEAGGLQEGSNGGEVGAATAVPGGNKGTEPGARSGADKEQVRPAVTAAPPEVSKAEQAGVKAAQQTQSKTAAQVQVRTVQPALEPAMTKRPAAAPLALMVQIATLAHQEDADVLVEALRRRGYAVGERHDVTDGMIHVRVGPFASRDVAEQWRQKLQNDGYNAVVEAQ